MAGRTEMLGDQFHGAEVILKGLLEVFIFFIDDRAGVGSLGILRSTMLLERDLLLLLLLVIRRCHGSSCRR